MVFASYFSLQGEERLVAVFLSENHLNWYKERIGPYQTQVWPSQTLWDQDLGISFIHHPESFPVTNNMVMASLTE